MLRWDLKRSPVRQAIFLRRVDADAGAARFYSLVVERDLFGQVVLVRNWGRIGTRGRELVEEHATEDDALRAMQKLVEIKRRRGYPPIGETKPLDDTPRRDELRFQISVAQPARKQAPVKIEKAARSSPITENARPTWLTWISMTLPPIRAPAMGAHERGVSRARQGASSLQRSTTWAVAVFASRRVSGRLWAFSCPQGHSRH
jgi:predicted DNA-binding WGR domain protein